VRGADFDPAGRHRGRVAALQLLYQREVGGSEGPRFEHAVGCYWQEHPAPDGPRQFADRLLRGTLEAMERIDPLIESASDNWRLSRMAVIDRLVLRLAVYELLVAETPAAVVIDEAIELARTFSDEPSPRFVNGVLDAVRQQLDRDRVTTGGPTT
jgi:N utilization substance protein B